MLLTLHSDQVRPSLGALPSIHRGHLFPVWLMSSHPSILTAYVRPTDHHSVCHEYDQCGSVFPAYHHVTVTAQRTFHQAMPKAHTCLPPLQVHSWVQHVEQQLN